MEKVHIIGIGSGGRRSLDNGALAIIETSDVLVGQKDLLDLFPGGKCSRYTLKKYPERTLKKALQERSDKKVVLLAAGDPGLSGFADRVLQLLPPGETVIHPAVDPVQVAFGLLGKSWHDALTIRLSEGHEEEALRRIAASEKVAIYTSETYPPGRITTLLRGRGLVQFSAYLFDERADSRLRPVNLLELEENDSDTIPPVLILLAGQTSRDRAFLEPLNLDDSLFEPVKGSLMSKEIRHETIHKMKLTPESVVWIIGIEDGSLATEVGLLVERGAVHAVEWEEERTQRLVESIARFDQARVKIYSASPLELVRTLPTPNVIYISARNDSIEDIAALCADRIDTRGRIVTNTVLYERTSRLTGKVRKAGMTVEVSLINLSKPFSDGDTQGIESCSFIFSVCAKRKEMG